MIYARELGEYHQRERTLRDTQVQEMSAASYAVQERERESIAFEIHDRIAQSLIAVFQQLQALESLARANPKIQSTVTRASDSLQEAIQESRNIMNKLYSPLLKQYGIMHLIKEDLGRFQQDTSCRVQSYADYPVRFAPDVEVALYRIFQEALMNIRRHAPSARNVIVSLQCRHNTVSLHIQDDGPGFDVEGATQNPGVDGITGMRRRAEAIGGSLEVTSIPGHGVKITTYVPVAKDSMKELPLR
jgi:signal transduction histidine kinase